MKLGIEDRQAEIARAQDAIPRLYAASEAVDGKLEELVSCLADRAELALGIGTLLGKEDRHPGLTALRLSDGSAVEEVIARHLQPFMPGFVKFLGSTPESVAQADRINFAQHEPDRARRKVA